MDEYEYGAFAGDGRRVVRNPEWPNGKMTRKNARRMIDRFMNSGHHYSQSGHTAWPIIQFCRLNYISHAIKYKRDPENKYVCGVVVERVFT